MTPPGPPSGKPDGVNRAREFEGQGEGGSPDRGSAARERIVQWLWPLAAVVVVVVGMVLGYAFFS